MFRSVHTKPLITFTVPQTQKQLEDSLKDNENLVMKYAYVEKKNIDLRALVEEKEGEIKRRDRELAQLQKQVATLRAEQQPRHRKYADSKVRPIVAIQVKRNGIHHFPLC